jgi:hypothetical protein
MAGRADFGQISEREFNSLLQALSSTSKGRAFLNEFRQRSQPEDTLGLIDSLQRIEGTMGAVRDQLQPERIADELRNIAMSLDLALDGAPADPDGDETARRFALADRARLELQTLAASLAGGAQPVTVTRSGDGAARKASSQGQASYTLRDPAADR